MVRLRAGDARERAEQPAHPRAPSRGTGRTPARPSGVRLRIEVSCGDVSGAKPVVGGERLLALGGGEGDAVPGAVRRAHGVDLEGDDDAEAPAAAAQRPEQVLALARGHAALAAVGGDDADRADAVEREAVARPESPIPPPSAWPPTATFGHEPAGKVSPRRASRAWVGSSRPPGRSRRGRRSRPRCRARRRRRRQRCGSSSCRCRRCRPSGRQAGRRSGRPTYDGLDVGAVEDLDHRRRADPVVARVEEDAGGVVAAVARREHLAAHGAAQRAQLSARERRGARFRERAEREQRGARGRAPMKSRRVVPSTRNPIPGRARRQPVRRIAIPVRMSSAARSSMRGPYRRASQAPVRQSRPPGMASSGGVSARISQPSRIAIGGTR